MAITDSAHNVKATVFLPIKIHLAITARAKKQRTSLSRYMAELAKSHVESGKPTKASAA